MESLEREDGNKALHVWQLAPPLTLGRARPEPL